MKPDGQSLAVAILKKLLSYGAAYMVLQTITGVEVGLVIVYLNMVEKLSITGAMVTAMPLGLPLLLVQGGLYIAYRTGAIGRIYRKLVGAPQPATAPAR